MSYEDRLRDTFHNAERSMPRAAISVEETIARGHRARRVYWASVAFATAAVIAVGGVSAYALRDGAPEPPTPASTPTPTPAAEVSLDAVVPAVDRWLEALAEGDAERAWRLTAPESRRSFEGGFAEFEDMATTLAEGFGAWAGATALEHKLTTVRASDSEAVVVVTLSGEVSQEYPAGPVARALPVRVVGDRALVDPFGAEAGVEVSWPESTPDPETGAPTSPEVAPDETFSANVPVGARSDFVVHRVGDGDEIDAWIARGTAEGSDALAEWSPRSPLDEGDYVLTVVADVGDDTFPVGAARFTVAAVSASATPTPTVTATPSPTGPTCSATGMSPEPVMQPNLTPEAATTRRAILAAAVECDYEGLAEIAAQSDTFAFTFGGADDPAEYWENAEDEGDEVMRVLVTVLNAPNAVEETPPEARGRHERVFAWPSVAGLLEPTAEDWRALVDAGLATDREVEDYKDFGGYYGWRASISASGAWLGFVAGD
ncbi:MAG TPA: hypothetical protein VHJ34_12605 [Actinomycetota bacterium]|nr:hypothetical protein [Actinomycetota bacterium]